MPKIYLILYFFFMSYLLVAQSRISSNELGTWNIINMKMGIQTKWDIIAETQLRSLSFYDNFHYYEYKGGINYSVNKQFAVFLGIGNYNTFQETGSFVLPKQNDELRTWQQLTMSQYVSRVKFEHRYRIEQRWTSTGFRNRFRYRINVAVPINQAIIQPKTLYGIIANEFFLTNQPPFFERNRFLVGLGYEISNPLAIQVAWINQLDYRLTNETNKNYWQISLLIDIELHHKQRSFTPSTVD